MAFTLFSSDNSHTDYPDDATYRFNDHHLLVVTLVDGTRRTYSPAAWLYIEDQRPDRSGRRASAVVV